MLASFSVVECLILSAKCYLFRNISRNACVVYP
nr:MAG TPA: hypothetical protein [Caudoviricetes sp.]